MSASNLDDEYQCRCRSPSDINEHLPGLRRLAEQCGHVIEFGTRTGNSTIAFLAARPKRLICYDVGHHLEAQRLVQLAEGTDVRLITADVLETTIDETDLLFIDTLHTERQLRQELARHAGKVRRFIVLHDTETFGQTGEDGSPGLKPALEQFLREHHEWRVLEHVANNNGLTVLVREP